jgi:hypothetical protein
MVTHPPRDGVDHDPGVPRGGFPPRRPDQLSRLPPAPPRQFHVLQQPGQERTVDDLDSSRTTRARDQQRTTPDKLVAVSPVLSHDRLSDDLVRQLKLRRTPRRAEQTQRIIAYTRRPALPRLRGSALGFVPLTTVLTH